MTHQQNIAWLASLVPSAISPEVAAEAQRQLDNEQAARERRSAANAPRPPRKQGWLELSQGKDE